MCKLNLLNGGDFKVLESQPAESDAELELEAYRLEAEAFKQELLYQLQASKQTIDDLIHSRKKHQKKIIQLENECRRLESENHQLKETLKSARRPSMRRVTVPPQRCILVNVGCQVEMRDEGRRDVKEVSEELAELKVECREQGGKVSNCLTALRETREVQKHVLDLVTHVQEALMNRAKPVCAIEPILETSESKEDPTDDHYSRLLDELQDCTNTDDLTSSFFQGSSTEINESCLLACPIQHQVDNIEAELQSLHASLKASKKPCIHHGKSASLQLFSPNRVNNKRKGSLERAYQIAFSTRWSLLA